MSAVPTILLQLDTDPQPSSFDAVVAVDSGVCQLLQYGNVSPDNVTSLVHGAIFTRSPSKLQSTAIFVGGSDIELAERNFAKVVSNFFGPMRVSVAMDANGCNTTSVAAVDCALQGLDQLQLDTTHRTALTALVLGGTGPVGRRVATLLADQGFSVRVHSRTFDKAERIVDSVRQETAFAAISPTAATGDQLQAEAVASQLVVNANAAGIESLGREAMEAIAQTPGVMVDLNAVPPAGLFGIGLQDLGRSVGQRLLYGALAVGAEKMKLHRAVIRACFLSNDQQLNLREIAALSRDRRVVT